ncbi:MAG: hypothetical protein A2341_19335 [Deltaproteobacteria bacterium RIFOXYB12_FULL_58_9]|nr:MAG: hypothetical protein A2341_19335 [Deltaproteobacteria bacterium RIFOXYB12_FULL_58_9]
MPPLNERQKSALRRFYSQNEIVDRAAMFMERGDWIEMEEYLQRDALIPLMQKGGLPDYMRDENGATIFPDGLNPSTNLEGWQDAIEVGWAVMKEKKGITHDHLHRQIARAHDLDWADFVRRADERKAKKEEEKD